MFSSSKRSAGRDRGGPRMPSIISAELRITGNLLAQGDVMIEGIVEGDIKCQSVTIGDSASVTGQIECDTARICGMVKGRVTAKAVTLAPTARVLGDIVHDSIAMEAGAYFEGQLRHRDTLAIAGPTDDGSSDTAKADGEPRSVSILPLKESRDAKDIRPRHSDARGSGKATGIH